MRAYYKENLQLYILFSVWLLAGMYTGNFVYLIFIPSLCLMWKKEMYEELFIGYLFILIISDNLDDRLYFAKNVKNIYITFLACLFFLNHDRFYPRDKVVKPFIPFFLFSIVTLFSSIADSFFFTSFQKTISFFLSFLIVPNFFFKLFRENQVLFLRRFVFFCLTMLLAGFVLKFLVPEVGLITTGRYRGVMGNPNGLGIFTLLVLIIFVVIDNFYPQLFKRKERLIIYGVIFLTLFMTKSRNSLFAFFIFYVCQYFFRYSLLLGFILFFIMLIAAEAINNNLTVIIISLGLQDYFRLNTIEDGSGRYIAWNFAWKQIQVNFFIGKGFAYNEYYMRQHYHYLSKLGHQGGIHNSFITFWMDQGLVGLLIYLRSFILTFIKAAQNTRYAFPIMFAISFTAIFESWLVGSLSAYAFLLMVIFSLITNEEIKNAAVSVHQEV